MEFLFPILCAFVVIAAMFAGVGLKYFLKKDKEVQGSCAARNELVNKDGEEGCSICGRTDTSSCDGSPAREAAETEKFTEVLPPGQNGKPSAD